MKELTIVMYHYVRDLKNSRYPNIKGMDVGLFEQQIQFFRTLQCSDNGRSYPHDNGRIFLFTEGGNASDI